MSQDDYKKWKPIILDPEGGLGYEEILKSQGV